MMGVGFAVWITGIPASGKTTIARALRERLERRGVKVEVLESDEVRRRIAPRLGYSEEDRDDFYRALVYVAELLVRNGVNVVLDATANKRAYREEARSRLPRFVEVYVKCPLEVAMRRDPKGLYAKALRGEIADLPGLQRPYEEPLSPELVVESDREGPERAAERIEAKLEELGYLKGEASELRGASQLA